MTAPVQASAPRGLVLAPGLRVARLLWRILPICGWVLAGLLAARIFGADAAAMGQVLLVASAFLGYGIAAALLREVLSPDRPWLRILPVSDLRAHRVDMSLRSVLFFVLLSQVGIYLVSLNGWDPIIADLARVLRNLAVVVAAFVLIGTTGLFHWLQHNEGNGLAATVGRFLARVAFPLVGVTLLVVSACRGFGYYPLSEWIARNAAWSILKLLSAVLVYRWLRLTLYRGIRFYTADDAGGDPQKSAAPGTSDGQDESGELGEAGTYALGAVRILTGLLAILLVVLAFLWVLHSWSLDLPSLVAALDVVIPGCDALTWLHMLQGSVRVALTLCAGWLMRSVLTYFIFPRSQVGIGGRYAILAVLRYLIVALAIVFGLGAFGVDMGSLSWFFGAAGIGLAFGLQDIIGNFVSGLIMLVERPIRVGDVVQIGTSQGAVEEIRMRGTTLRTFDNTTLLIPNSQMLGERVTNLTHGLGYARLKIPVLAPHDVDPRKIESILLESALGDVEVLTDPKPFVWFSEFSPSSLDFTLVCFTAQLRGRFGVASRIRFVIMEKMRAAGIEIPYPQQDLHIKTAPSEAVPLEGAPDKM